MDAVKSALLLTMLVGFLYLSVTFATVVVPAYCTRLPEFEDTYHRWARRLPLVLVGAFVVFLAASLLVPGLASCVLPDPDLPRPIAERCWPAPH